MIPTCISTTSLFSAVNTGSISLNLINCNVPSGVLAFNVSRKLAKVVSHSHFYIPPIHQDNLPGPKVAWLMDFVLGCTLISIPLGGQQKSTKLSGRQPWRVGVQPDAAKFSLRVSSDHVVPRGML